MLTCIGAGNINLDYFIADIRKACLQRNHLQMNPFGELDTILHSKPQDAFTQLCMLFDMACT
jgi:hypothetical protein